MNENVQILSIEGKDLLTKNYRVNKNTIRKGSLDDSMEVDKIKTLGKKIIKLDKKKNRYYTNDVITVTFKYACKGDRDLTDEEYERVESLKLTLSLIKDKEERKQIKEQIRIAERKINKKDIRHQLYKYGFNINIDGKNKHFVRYKRTSGSARVGKCLFISDKLAKEMIDWSFAGIEHSEGTSMDCAGMEAYISLPTSSAIDRFKLKAENILLIDDCYSKFRDTVMATKFINEEYDDDGNIIGGDLYTDVDTTDIKNNLFDGESLLDKSIFEEYEYGDKATLQLRNRFFKGIGVNTDIQKFFRDNNITDVSQLNGKTIATDIKQIKLITTPSSVKYLKFGTFEQWLAHIEENWAICKYEKPQHHFNGMAQTHYQLLNTLGMSKNEMEEFLEDTINYINLLKTDIAVFKYHLGINSDIESEEELEQKNELPYYIDSSNDFILNMLEINEDFEYTKMCKKYRENSINSYIRNARRGHILVEGNYSIMVSCPYEYLLASIGKFDGNSLLKPFECVSSKFKDGERLLGVRSPEPTMANIAMFTNTTNKILDRYFNTNSKEVLYLSPINNNIMEQLSSCDWDGDAILITNNKYLVKAGDRLSEIVDVNGIKIKRFLTSTDFTPKSSIKRKYTAEDLADTDIKCSANKIGEIINLAQMLNSLYWDKKHKGAKEEELLELYKDISNLNILSCIEIDRAKKISPVDARKELSKIREKHTLGTGFIKIDGEKKEVKVRPMFFKYLDGGMNYKFKRFETGMDYLNKILDEKIKRKKENSKELQLSSILIKKKISKQNRKSIMMIKRIVKEMRRDIKNIWCGDYDNKYELYKDTKSYYYDKLSRFKINDEIIYCIIKRVSLSTNDIKYKEYKDCGKLMLNALYDINKIEFIKNIKVKPKNNSYIYTDNNGNISIYGVKFSKIN